MTVWGFMLNIFIVLKLLCPCSGSRSEESLPVTFVSEGARWHRKAVRKPSSKSYLSHCSTSPSVLKGRVYISEPPKLSKFCPSSRTMQSHLWHVLTSTEPEQVGCSSASYSFTYAQVELKMGSEKVMKPEVSACSSKGWTLRCVQVVLCTATLFQLYRIFGNYQVSLSRH